MAYAKPSDHANAYEEEEGQGEKGRQRHAHDGEQVAFGPFVSVQSVASAVVRIAN